MTILHDVSVVNINFSGCTMVMCNPNTGAPSHHSAAHPAARALRCWPAGQLIRHQSVVQCFGSHPAAQQSQYERLGTGLAQAWQIWICMGPFKIIQGWNYPSFMAVSLQNTGRSGSSYSCEERFARWRYQLTWQFSPSELLSIGDLPTQQLI